MLTQSHARRVGEAGLTLADWLVHRKRLIGLNNPKELWRRRHDDVEAECHLQFIWKCECFPLFLGERADKNVAIFTIALIYQHLLGTI